MKEEIKVPSVGESITTGVIVTWLKQNGDSVQDGDILFELETDKAVLEIPSTGSGTLKILVDEGTEVAIGQTVAMLGDGQAAAKPSIPTEVEARHWKRRPHHEGRRTSCGGGAEALDPARGGNGGSGPKPASGAAGRGALGG